MEEKLFKLLMDSCDSKEIYNNRNINMFETGLIDSLGLIELLMALEEEFNIDIEPAEIKKDAMSTPNQLLDFIRRKINA